MTDIPILYEDSDLIVCQKPVGVLSQPDATGTGEDMLSLLSEKNRGKPVYLVHRLDRGVGGVMVFAKHARAAGRLSAMVADRSITKQYLAVIHGRPTPQCGVLKDLLFKDRTLGKTFVVDRMRKGVKEASLAYATLATREDTPHGTLSLVQIRLHTGRTHQIRVQFSSRGMPLSGDGKYGARDHGSPIGLWSYRLSFVHPFQKGSIVDVCKMPEGNTAFSLFDDVSAVDDPEQSE